MEEIINNLINEANTLKKSNLKQGSVDKLLDLWKQFSSIYGILELKEYKYNTPIKSVILDGLIRDFDEIKTRFHNQQSMFINFGLIYNHILQLKK